MMNRSNLTLSTSPLSQPARSIRRTASLTRRQRSLYGRKRHYSTVKERDTETGLHYYGARYLDGKTSRWLSGDPAVGDYVPSVPVNDEARKRNGNLPGQGGVFNYVNLHVYHYAGNNPVKYTDPDGRMDLTIQLGIGKGAALKIKFQLKDKRLTIGMKVGLGVGLEGSVSINNETQDVGSTLSLVVEGNIGASFGPYAAGINAEISADTNGEINNDMEASITVPNTGIKAGVKIDNGVMIPFEQSNDSTDIIPEEFSVSGMIFIGVGLDVTIDFN